MRSDFLRPRAAHASAVAGLLAATHAFAQSYTFTNIIDESGPLSYFRTPAINNEGVATFFAIDDLTGLGVFAVDGEVVLEIAANEHLADFSKVIIPAINDDGTVVFSANLADGTSGIFAGTGGPFAPVIDDSSEFFLFNDPAINNAGEVAFRAEYDTGIREEGVFKVLDGTLTTIADDAGAFCCFGLYPAINNHGDVAFHAFLDALPNDGIFVGNGKNLITIANTSGAFEFFGFNTAPSINDHGVVAFRAELDNGEAGVFTGNGGLTATIADTSGPYDQFLNPDINNAGTIVFGARLDDGRDGIFTGPDPVRDKVIIQGDDLFGSTLTLVVFYRGLNEQGDMTFRYQLENGVEGVAVASPVTLPGDMNNDNVVNGEDQAAFCAAIGAAQGEPEFQSAADLNNDGVIDHLDLAIFNEALRPCDGDVVSSDTFQPPADGVTDGADLAYLLGAWGAQPSCADFVASKSFEPPPDGKVDAADLAFLLGAWGACE